MEAHLKHIRISLMMDTQHIMMTEAHLKHIKISLMTGIQHITKMEVECYTLSN